MTELHDEKEILALPSLSLAYLGDSVFELFVRDFLINSKKMMPGKLHKAALEYVSAPKQAEAVKKLSEHLTEREMQIYKRGRNAKVNSVPKNATISEYHSATGLEALFGYLYLAGENERLKELFNIIIGE